VTIDDVECALQTLTDTEIVCRTGAHTGAMETKVRVEKGSDGTATQVRFNNTKLSVQGDPVLF
jgi:hypothetical protein